MAGGISNYGANLVLDIVFGGGSSAPATYHIAACTSAPVVGDTGTTIAEPSGGSYARVAFTNNTTNWENSSVGAKKNKVAVSFPTATGSWGTIKYYAITDASSGGNLICWGKLTSPVSIVSGKTLIFNPGQLVYKAISLES